MPGFRPEYDCPLEIWMVILDMACEKHGSVIARSLSLVSKRFQEISKGHLYYSIKIGSMSQLLNLYQRLALDTGIESASEVFGTHSLSILLPTAFWHEAYPESSFSPPDGDSDDESYTESSESGDSGTSMSPEEQEELLYELEDLEDIEVVELMEEVAEVNYTKALMVYESSPANWPPIACLEDLIGWSTGITDFEFKIYSSIRRLLEACARSLETFSLFLMPSHMVPHDLIFPVLPHLRFLAISLHHELSGSLCIRRAPILDENGIEKPDPPVLLFPNLRSLVLAKPDESSHQWLMDLLQSCGSPGDEKLTVFTGRYLWEDSEQAPTYNWEITELLDRSEMDPLEENFWTVGREDWDFLQFGEDDI